MRRSDFLRLIPGLGAAVALPKAADALTDEVPITDPELRRQLLGLTRFRHIGALELDNLADTLRFYRRRNLESCGAARERIKGADHWWDGDLSCPATFTYEYREKETEAGIILPDERYCLCGYAEWPKPVCARCRGKGVIVFESAYASGVAVRPTSGYLPDPIGSTYEQKTCPRCQGSGMA